MRSLLIALALLGLAACAKSKCEKYADMEWKCGDYPADEKDITMALAKGMCEAGESGEKAAARFTKEAACAEKHKECAAYKACTDAVEKAEFATEPAPTTP